MSGPTSLQGLIDHLDASVSPAHSVHYAAERLRAAGFVETHFGQFSQGLPGLGFVADAGLLLAWRQSSDAHSSVRIIGAHTDSPGLKIKPRPDVVKHGWQQLGVEIYGGILNNSWLDRDLGLAGRVVLRNGSSRLFDSVAPVARIPQLAVHLDREVNERGLVLDKQAHLVPVWGLESAESRTFADWLAQNISCSTAEIASWDIGLYDTTKAQLLGADQSLLASGRLDNQISCWAATEALLVSTGTTTNIIALFDHEEVGSSSTHGAAGPRLEWLLEALHRPASDRVSFIDRLAVSHCLSVDNAHAIHPNYPERHEPGHAPRPNAGPVIKQNANQRYATTPESQVPFILACEKARVPHQIFVSNNSQPCGSTIGPISATRLGIPTLDIGVAQLSMHSARELCGALDPVLLARALSSYFS
jgi:aspartyl aminopeptidase